MVSSDPPPLTKDSVPPRAERRLRTIGRLALAGALVVVVILLLLAWWLSATSG